MRMAVDSAYFQLEIRCADQPVSVEFLLNGVVGRDLE